MLSSSLNLRALSLEVLSQRRLLGLVAAVILFDVAPAPGENLSRCSSEQTPLVELELTLEQSELRVGETTYLSAVGTWENGDVSSDFSPAYSSSPEGIVRISGDTVTALAEGQATIFAEQDGVRGQVAVTVLPTE